MATAVKLTVAIDTVTEPATLALFAGDEPLLVHQVFGARMVLAELGNFLSRASAEATRAGEPISLVAVSVGPGGFSGSRIGVAAAKSFAKARGTQVLVFDHQEALAHAAAAQAGREPPMVVLGDARRGQWHMLPLGELGSFSETLDVPECERRLELLGSCRVVACSESIAAKLAAFASVELVAEAYNRLAGATLGAYLADLAERREPIVPELVEVRYVREYEAVAKFPPRDGG
ncbi:MAG: tRNA (adenosine(37)-N6)-threonylcarbamoyltransferase complex dimerization subunit type 1 TsaB [Actinomycetota bacterium]|nr:tRNA (adenosine(37)-N6)-threonylcarbamoyltransferase complex dimerization subunit type 1 TsaB [Actinomycetota bacterium]